MHRKLHYRHEKKIMIMFKVSRQTTLALEKTDYCTLLCCARPEKKKVWSSPSSMNEDPRRRMSEQFVDCKRGLFRSFYFVNLSCWIQYNFPFNTDDRSGLTKLLLIVKVSVACHKKFRNCRHHVLQERSNISEKNSSLPRITSVLTK